MRKAKLEHVLHIAVADRTEEAAKLLHQVPGAKKIELVDAEDSDAYSRGDAHKTVIHLTIEDSAVHNISDIPNRLINAGFRLTSFGEEPVNLETAFMRLTQGLVQ
jgi:hypothetical protein